MIEKPQHDTERGGDVEKVSEKRSVLHVLSIDPPYVPLCKSLFAPLTSICTPIVPRKDKTIDPLSLNFWPPSAEMTNWVFLKIVSLCSSKKDWDSACVRR